MCLKTALLLLIIVTSCAKQAPVPQSSDAVREESVAFTEVPLSNSVRDFEPVKAMLSQNCSPCHVPGGKMYERLPFDNPETVRAHKDSIVRRLKSPEEKEILENWLR